MDERLITYNILRSQGYSRRKSAKLSGYSTYEQQFKLNEIENNVDGLAYRESIIDKYGDDYNLKKHEIINDIHDYIHQLMEGDESFKRARVITDLYSIVMRSLDAEDNTEDEVDNWNNIEINIVQNRDKDIDLDDYAETEE